MTADTLLASVLEGAGLRRDQVTPELAENLGKILRIVVAGVKDVLDARTQTKTEFGMDMTMLRPAENNPLKFSANVDDALHNLLVKRNPAFLGPVEAFEDAFDDLRHHQIAMLTALRVAFDAMLKQFDPDTLQVEFDRQVKKSGGLSALAKWRYWELYRSMIHEMTQDADDCYRDLFGDEFARAYEEQLKRLKSQRRATSR
jgi:type VI secretion system FHA domain protein